MVNGGNSAQQFEWTMDVVQDYGLDGAEKYTLLDVNIDGSADMLGQFNSATVSGSVRLDPLQIRFYRILHQ